MKEQKCLEQLESKYLFGKVLRDEILQRFYITISYVEDLTFTSACSAQEALIHCGFSYFEALYFLCGDELRYCPLLSKTTQEFIQKIFVKKGENAVKETWKNSLEKIIDEIDEKLFFSLLERDSKRLEKIILSSVEPAINTGK